MRRFTKQEIELMKNKYPILGSKINIILNRTRKSIINKANRLNISYIIKRTKIIKCINCSEIISYGSKSLLCRSCYAKKYRIKQLRKHNYGKLWTNEELVYLYKNYWNGEKEKLCLKSWYLLISFLKD